MVVADRNDTEELRRIAGSSNMYARLGLDPQVGDDELADRGRAGGQHWRTRAANPLADPGEVALATALTRWYDLVWAMATNP